MKNLLKLFGSFSVVLFLIPNIFGPILTHNYNWISETISTLMVNGAENKIFMDLFIFFSAVFIQFYSILFYFVCNSFNKIQRLKLSFFLFISGVLGELIIFFPWNNEGLSNVSSIIHITAVGLGLIDFILIVFLFYLFSKQGNYKKFSLISFLIVLISGLIATLMEFILVEYIGLFERISIFSFMIWFAVTIFFIDRENS